MKKSNTSKVMILGAALIAASWLIKGEDIMQNFALPARIKLLLLYAPAMLVVVLFAVKNKKFYASEKRAWKRIFGK